MFFLGLPYNVLALVFHVCCKWELFLGFRADLGVWVNNDSVLLRKQVWTIFSALKTCIVEFNAAEKFSKIQKGVYMRGYMDVIECSECAYRDKCHREIALKEYDEDIDANYVSFQKLTFCSYGKREKGWFFNNVRYVADIWYQIWAKLVDGISVYVDTIVGRM